GDRHYATVADEISSGQVDKVTWTKAFAHSGGDERATKSLYCRYRVNDLTRISAQKRRRIRFVVAVTQALLLLVGIALCALGGLLTSVTPAQAGSDPDGFHYVHMVGRVVETGALVQCVISLTRFCKAI